MNFLLFDRNDVEPEEDQQYIINPIEPSMTTRSSHLNEVNSDFADRSKFHQAHTVQSGAPRFND